MSEPLLELIRMAADLMHPAFAPAGKIAAARLEFYHQFRKLWDRGIPVGLGLGHLLLKADGDVLVVERIGEKGAASETIARIGFGKPGESITIAFDGTKWRIAG